MALEHGGVRGAAEAQLAEGAHLARNPTAFRGGDKRPAYLSLYTESEQCLTMLVCIFFAAEWCLTYLFCCLHSRFSKVGFRVGRTKASAMPLRQSVVLPFPGGPWIPSTSDMESGFEIHWHSTSCPRGACRQENWWMFWMSELALVRVRLCEVSARLGSCLGCLVLKYSAK